MPENSTRVRWRLSVALDPQRLRSNSASTVCMLLGPWLIIRGIPDADALAPPPAPPSAST
jgi:hypothetical protein